MVKGTANITFAPGFSPDWGQPAVFYAGIMGDTSNFGLQEGTVFFQFSGTSNHITLKVIADMAYIQDGDSWNPSANSSLEKRVSIDLDTQIMGYGTFDQYDIVVDNSS